MTIQRVGARPGALVHQAAAGFTLDGTQPTVNVPVFDANANLVFPTEAAANGGGLFELEQDRTVSVQRVHIDVPSGDVAGWSLFVSDGALDVLVESTAALATSYAAVNVPITLMRGENLKLVMAGVSAGLIRAKVIANIVDTSGEI